MLERKLPGEQTRQEAISGVKVVHTTLETLQGHQNEPNSLSLATAPLTIATRRLGENSFEHMAVFGLPLSKGELYNFLKRASNDRYDPGILDVSSDWSNPDRSSWHKPNPTYGRKKQDGTHASLDEIHQAYKAGWTTFQTHRHDFIDAVRDANAEPNYLFSMPSILSSEYVTKKTLVENARKQLLEPKSLTTATLLAEMSKFETIQLTEILKQSRSRRRLTIKEKKMKSDQLSRKILYRIRNSVAYREVFFDSELWQRIVDDYISANFKAGTFQVDKDQNLMFYRRKKENDPGDEPVQIPLTITRDTGSGYNTYHDEYKNGKLVYVKNKPTREMQPQPSLTPAIHWIIQNGVRHLHTEAIDDHPLIQTALEHEVGPRVEKSKFDALLGLLTILYFSPNIRKSLPTTMGSPHAVRDNKMGPGQIVVYAPLQKKQLESADILPILEQAT